MNGTEFSILIYLILINISAFLLFAVDKHKAKKSEWRISERTLICICALGGSAGGIAGMYVFRHKTQKNKFRVGIPLLLIIQAAVLISVKAGLF